MPRIVLPTPQPVLFHTHIHIQIGDINYGNHLANDAVLRLCHEARIRWLAKYGFTELNTGGIGLIMADAAIQYTAQAQHGDELAIELGAIDISRSSFVLLYHLRRSRDGQTIAKVQTGMVCFDYGTQKVGKIPAALYTILQAT